MKTTVQTETYVCDTCGKEETYASECLKCGTHHCFSCKETNGKHYSHGVFFSGSGDGYYCIPCDNSFALSGGDARWKAYREVADLRDERVRWEESFTERREKAEAKVGKLAKR